MKPNVYLAGKIGKNDWRHALVPGLRNHLWSDGPIDCKSFTYCGPFFVSCDHGCNHGPNLHGALSGPDFTSCGTNPITRAEVIANNLASLESADLVFVYITATDCHGTMGEIGWAIAKQKRVVMCFAPDIDPSDFWMWANQVHAVHTSVRPCCLHDLLSDAIAELIARSSSSFGGYKA
jgi:hypothetical protein